MDPAFSRGNVKDGRTALTGVGSNAKWSTREDEMRIGAIKAHARLREVAVEVVRTVCTQGEVPQAWREAVLVAIWASNWGV